MVKIFMKYAGDLHCEAIHEPSGTELSTDAPVDNKGRGESFSPTDLVATALGTCILTTMAIVGRDFGVDIAGAIATVEKEMVLKPIRRIGALRAIITMPAGLPEQHRKVLESAAHHCPVHKSLHPDVDAPITIVWN